MVLGVHILDLCHDLLGEPAWCFARVSDRGSRSVGRATSATAPRGSARWPATGSTRCSASPGTPAVAHFATSRPKEPGRGSA